MFIVRFIHFVLIIAGTFWVSSPLLLLSFLLPNLPLPPVCCCSRPPDSVRSSRVSHSSLIFLSAPVSILLLVFFPSVVHFTPGYVASSSLLPANQYPNQPCLFYLCACKIIIHILFLMIKCSYSSVRRLPECTATWSILLFISVLSPPPLT